MRREFILVLWVIAILLSACGLQPMQAIEPPTALPATVAPSTLPPLNETPAASVPVLVGPEMRVGSTYLYVDGSVLIAVPAGKFIMGNNGTDNPIREITLSDFWIYRSPVTNAQYARCVEAGQCVLPDLKKNQIYADPLRANDPVVGVNYEQAGSYCKWVNGRLPTEAEWEKTARGPDGNIYPWGDAAPSCDLMNFATCVNQTTDVTRYPQGQSYYGAFDMAGNVFEWVADWYQPTYYAEAPEGDPLGPDIGVKRSVRSSGFLSPAYFAESARRSAGNPGEQRNDLGFRCVIEDPTAYAPFCETSVVYQPAPSASLGGNSPGSTCPDISITQTFYCSKYNTPVTNIRFSGPEGAIIDPGSCRLLDGNLYECFSPSTVQICSECDLAPVGPPSCSAPFVLSADGKSCVYTGGVSSGSACLPGFTYNADARCCQAMSTGASYPLCPTGTYYVNGGCYPYPAVGKTCQTANVNFTTCGGGSQGGPCPPGQTRVCRPDPNCPPTIACKDICTCQ